MKKRWRGVLTDVLTVATGLCALALTSVVLWERVTGHQVSLESGDSTERIIEDWRGYALDGHWVGKREAPVVLVEFGDYQCSACRMFQGSLEAAQRTLGDSVAVVYRHLPLNEVHPMAETAARAAECAARQGRFKEFHIRLNSDDSWLAVGREGFKKISLETGVPDSLAFSRCLLEEGAIPAVERDRDAARRLGVAKTPSTLINDRLVVGAVGLDALLALIREAANASSSPARS